MSDKDSWSELAQQLRVDAVRTSGKAGSGHPTSSMSAAELMAVLVAGHLRYDFAEPDNPANDHLIFSKGHASPLLYAIYKAVGAVGDDELDTYRRFGSPLEGHPTPVLAWVDVATGSPGPGHHRAAHRGGGPDPQGQGGGVGGRRRGGPRQGGGALGGRGGGPGGRPGHPRGGAQAGGGAGPPRRAGQRRPHPARLRGGR